MRIANIRLTVFACVLPGIVVLVQAGIKYKVFKSNKELLWEFLPVAQSLWAVAVMEDYYEEKIFNGSFRNSSNV